MRFKLDENLPCAVQRLLEGLGHDVHSVLDENLEGKPDPVIADTCRTEGRVLLTLDVDFADIRNYPPALSPGIVVLRVRRQDVRTISSLVSRALELLQTEQVSERLWIVTDTTTRIRGGDKG